MPIQDDALNTSHLEQALLLFKQTLPPSVSEQEKLPLLRTFLMRFADALPRFRLDLCDALYPILRSDTFSTNSDVRAKAALRLLLSNVSAIGQLGDTDKAKPLCLHVISESHRLGSPVEEADAHNILGDYYSKQSKWSEAVSSFDAALQLFRLQHDRLGEAMTLNNLGIVYNHLGDYPATLRHYDDARLILELLGEPSRLAPVYTNLGQTHFRLGQYDDALSFFYRALSLCNEKTMLRGVAILYANIGAVYERQSKYADALQLQEKNLRLREQLEDRRGLATGLSHIGVIHLSQHSYAEAVSYLGRAVSVAESGEHLEILSESSVMLGRCFSQQVAATAATGTLTASENAALDYLHRGAEIAARIGSRYLEQRAYQFLAEEYEQVNNLEQAYFYFKRYDAVKTEIFNEESDRRIKNLQVVYQVEETKKQAELERLKNIELAEALSQAERQRTIAQEASRIKSEVLNAVAHDLQSPISSVVNFAWLLKQASSFSEKELEMLSRIETVSQTMLQKTVDLLTAAQREKI